MPTDEERDPEPRLDRARSVLALAGGLAHELGNLLAANLMILDLLAAGSPGEAGGRALAELSASTREAVHAVRQLLRLARAAEGELVVFQLQHLFSDLRKLAAFVFPRTPIAIDYPADLWPLAGDPLAVYQLLLGLLQTARAGAADPAGEVRIAARNLPAAAPQVEIEVTAAGAPGQRVALPAVVEAGSGDLAALLARLRSEAAGR